MTALKGGEIDRFLQRPDPARPIVLIYGPDTGLVSERARTFAGTLGIDPSDPFALVRMEGDDLASHPTRLAEEAATIGLFGGHRLIWIRAGEKPLVAAIEPVLRMQLQDTSILIEAGDLKQKAPLRAAIEKADSAVALPCYLDGDADLRRMIADECRAAGLTIGQRATDLLVQGLGGNRAASRAEVRKLCLYAHGQPEITADDVAAICGDSSNYALDDIIDAAMLGHHARLDRLLAKAAHSGVSGGQIILAALRHVGSLHLAQVNVEAGTRRDQAMARFQPPVFYKRQASVERQMDIWSARKLDRAMSRLADALLRTRTHADMAPAIVNRALMGLAMSVPAPRG